MQQVAEGESAVAPLLRMQAGWALTGWSPPLSNIAGPTNLVAQTSFVLVAGGACRVKVGGTGSGASWAEATGDLQGAIEAMATVGGQVWVAAGTVRCRIPGPNGGTAVLGRHFSLRNGVAVLGGFPATADPGSTDRSPSAYPSVCSGFLGGLLGSVYQVFFHPSGANLDASARLDGMVISDGGMGMLNQGSSPTVSRCVFRSNYTQGDGGAICLMYSSSLITHCVIA